MANTLSIHSLLQLSLLVSLLRLNSATRSLLPNSTNKPAPKSRPHPPLNPHNHNRPFLQAGKITIHLIWYGSFTPSQRAIVSDFVTSFCFPSDQNSQSPTATIAAWWKAAGSRSSSSVVFRPPSAEIIDDGYSLGKSLTNGDIIELASRGGRKKNAINVVLTSPDVGVDGFCSRRCGARGSAMGAPRVSGKTSKFAYIWVGNAETECPGQCAWPTLLSPNRDVGMEGIVINLARLLIKTVVNPLGDGNLRMV